jgi:2-polyprenyl-3-methyl-5-hydroxy-6-metoxy-1,4-benzoquinol methylase
MITKSVNHNYFSFLRPGLISMIKGNPNSVLEIGCGTGLLLSYCKKTLGSDKVVGIELNEEAASIAMNRPEVDTVLIGDIEQIQTSIQEKSFDCLIASHVLEHLSDPWTSLQNLSRYVRPGGQILIGLPNARHVNLTIPLLLQGRLQYTESGILDRTHLRFFTRNSMIELVGQADLLLDEILPEYGERSARYNYLTLGLLSDHFAYAYNLSCTRPSE